MQIVNIELTLEELDALLTFEKKSKMAEFISARRKLKEAFIEAKSEDILGERVTKNT